MINGVTFTYSLPQPIKRFDFIIENAKNWVSNSVTRPFRFHPLKDYVKIKDVKLLI